MDNDTLTIQSRNSLASFTIASGLDNAFHKEINVHSSNHYKYNLFCPKDISYE